jgi:hypothetical protein
MCGGGECWLTPPLVRAQTANHGALCEAVQLRRFGHGAAKLAMGWIGFDDSRAGDAIWPAAFAHSPLSSRVRVG